MRCLSLMLVAAVCVLAGCQSSTTIPAIAKGDTLIVDERTEAGRFADSADAVRVRDCVIVSRMDLSFSVLDALGPTGRQVLLTMSAGTGPTPTGIYALAMAAHREPGSDVIVEVPTE